MDDQTFAAALSKYRKVRPKDYRGRLSRPLKAREKKDDAQKTVSQQRKPARHVDERTAKILRGSPFFSLLNQKLEDELGEQDSKECTERVLRAYERMLSRLNIEEIEEILSSSS